MNNNLKIAAAAAALSLSACGGATTSSTTSTVTTEPVVETGIEGIDLIGAGTFTKAELNGLITVLNMPDEDPDEPLGQITGSDIPTSGTATYNGFIALGTASIGGSQVGRMEMTVGFAGAGTITGQATDFGDSLFEPADDEQALLDGSSIVSDIPGTLTISNGEIDRNATGEFEQITAELKGDLDFSYGNGDPDLAAFAGTLGLSLVDDPEEGPIVVGGVFGEYSGSQFDGVEVVGVIALQD